MIKTLEYIKNFKTPKMPLEDIAKALPRSIAHSFNNYQAITPNNTRWNIGYDSKKLLEFELNLGACIANQKFDYLYNIMLQFLINYSFVYSVYRYYIKFSEEDLNKYKNLCDSFKGKMWDDIASDFAEGTYKFFSSGKVNNHNIE